MSLVNDVLRDLEKRGERPPSDQPNVAVDGPRRLRPALLISVLGGLLLAAPLLWLGFDATSSPEAETTSSPVASAGTAVSPTTGLPTLSVSKRSIEPALARAPQKANTRPDGGPVSPSPDDEGDPVRPIAKMESTPRKVHPLIAAPPSRSVNSNAGTEAPRREPEQDSSSPAGDDGKASISVRRAGSDTQQTLMDARQAIRRGETGDAKKRLEALLARNPRNGEARLLLGRLLRDNGRPQAAKDVLATGLEQGATDSDLALALARLHLDRDRNQEAVEVLERHRPALPDTPEYHLTLAAAQRLAERHEAAAGVYREFLQHYPESGTGWIGLGLSLESLGRPEPAVQAYENALAKASKPRVLRFARQRLSALTQTPQRQRANP